MAEYASILFSMILVNNFVLVKFLGICPFLGVSKKFDSAVGMGAAVTLVMVLAIAVTWPLQQLLDAWGLQYLQTIVFILVIATLVQLLEMAMKRFLPPLHASLGVFLPLITTNCAVLGVAILTIDEGYDYPQALVAGLGAGLGFLLAMVIFSGVRRTLEDAEPPEAFRGMPITLIAAAITAMSFMGFSGVIDHLFGA
ncbi:MAG: RnfABCDGE type electron transport complex subunit A [Atopobiaceae bacterium]|nr:RnfABCDGE type electron transport complex subunit A [Atopobiaceae bacterium]